MKTANQVIPHLVHDHYSRDNLDLPFWLGLAQETGGPILELGCGTGRVLIPLAQAGYVTFGLDHDAGMLAFLGSIAPDAVKARIHLIRADISAFHFGQQFSLILLPCNTLSTMTAIRRGHLFERVRQHLTPGGLFAASIPNPACLLALPAFSEPEVEEIIVHPLTGYPVQVSSAWQLDKDHFHLVWHYDHLLPDGQVQRMTLETAHDLTQAEDYQRVFNEAGLRLREVYGDFDLSPLDENSLSCIFVLEKRIGEAE